MALKSQSSDLACSDMIKVDHSTVELRSRIQDIIAIDPDFDEDYYLYFWLKVGRFSVAKTEEKIREALEWRKEKKVDLALSLDYNEDMARSFQVFMDGKTKSGFLAWTGYAGVFKLRETVARCGKETVLFHWLQLASKAEKLIIECNKDVLSRNKNVDTRNWPLSKKSILILNAKNLPYSEILSKDVISVGISLVKMATCYFPALEGTLCIINAGRVMDFILRLLQPLLKGSNVDLLVFDCNEENWRSAILDYIEADQIRTPFGGTREYIGPTN